MKETVQNLLKVKSIITLVLLGLVVYATVNMYAPMLVIVEN